MARPRRRSDIGVSLFPFLSILACSIGVLIVIISGQNMLAVGTSTKRFIDPRGAPPGKEPVFVECTGEGVLIHPEGEKVPLEKLSDASSPFGKLLDELAASEGKRYLVLLVRPPGIETFDECEEIVDRRNDDPKLPGNRRIGVGKEAIPAEWILRSALGESASSQGGKGGAQ